MSVFNISVRPLLKLKYAGRAFSREEYFSTRNKSKRELPKDAEHSHQSFARLFIPTKQTWGFKVE